MADLKAAAVIPARYGSTRFPGKALAEINGVPMIVRVIEQVKKAKKIDRVITATDDMRIKEAVEAAGGEAVMTSSEHRSGTDRIAEAAENLTEDLIVNVQGDEPLIKPEMIASALAPFLQEEDLQISTLKIKMNRDEAENPDIVKVICDKNDNALYFSRSPIPYLQAGEADYFQHVGLYVYRRDFLLKYSQMEASPLEKAESLEQLRVLENGYRIKVIEIEGKLIGVDRKEDIKKVEAVLRDCAE
ncbi:3-deoxy-manno-octulosonate cytidylyltransferase [Halanaerobium sp. MA284_MarDTE_T2]|uniref:3-deoxy-manno-octulosonate cytidylyltransferase n=1 Tax=Halanaerobium sp. MA284_MarDTE_T2 TaxID=2183913 RepID=UPI000DF491D2|nr:3-deoxy-manno-octulosonate cytidylyltransferase [Halanaerobium sp. MA284_MarDTE_T2]RCW45020.1 3-deoxy-manno-octulosonate cytidylyltransferase (CMP-KDO synthetase) [Halanaerobium sp. MA284_MarDTE_T2]